MFYYDSSFLAKSSVRYYPGIGKIAECIQTVFINRADTKEKKAEYMKIIQDRQVQAETGEIPPIIIYPEGATTNGETLTRERSPRFVESSQSSSATRASLT